MNTDLWGFDEEARDGYAWKRTIWRMFSTAAALAAVVTAVLVTSAAAAPKQIVFSGELRGISVDVGAGDTGDTFRTIGGMFIATAGLKSGTYSSTFTLGAITFPNPVTAVHAVTGTFTLETNGGTITAAVIPGSSYVVRGPTPSSFHNRYFNLELEVVGGTGRFKKMAGTLAIDFIATMCGVPPGPDPPECPFGSDPTPDWFTWAAVVTGTLTRAS